MTINMLGLGNDGVLKPRGHVTAVTCAASYVMVLVSVWTMGTSFVEISVFCAANVSEIVTISVFTTGGYRETEAVSEQHTPL